jgi:hypothetical protein
VRADQPWAASTVSKPPRATRKPTSSWCMRRPPPRRVDARTLPASSANPPPREDAVVGVAGGVDYVPRPLPRVAERVEKAVEVGQLAADVLRSRHTFALVQATSASAS